ncbi:hypothetical protein PG985_014707 [Apiospora marii]|uniref:uncharacterized protein n=1 Tax=Apiospora marii TaxID=335849 RepID=UPI00312E2A1B
MAPIMRIAATLAAVAGLALGETIDWKQVEGAGPAVNFELEAQAAAPVTNYTVPVALGDASIRAPLDCKDRDTYLGQQFFTEGPLQTGRCADACTAQREWDAKWDGGKKPCRFFNTYTLVKVTKGDKAGTPSVSTPAGQVCALYTESWPASYATDKGQWRDNTLFVITDSWSASNAANPSSGDCTRSTVTPKPTVTPAPTGLTTKTVTTTTTTSK